MLDTYGRKHISKVMKKIAYYCHKKDITANAITYFALFVGLTAAGALYFNKTLISLLLLWTSGFLDVLDGELARISKMSSQQGMLMDIFFDRIVESSILIVIALMHANLQLNIIFLFFSILMSMTIFLISGNIIENTTVKSFYYQAGLMERTEGFIMLSLIIFLQNAIIINLFTLFVLITVIQRFSETIRYLKLYEKSIRRKNEDS
jgi:CDP-diacylglycerol--glycerol-3-phosphate 3-phosphatidyltransferase